MIESIEVIFPIVAESATVVFPTPLASDVAVIPRPGSNGLTAYEVAVANGFVGSESEWLESLSADVTAANIGTALASAESKAAPVDADSVPILDSAASNSPNLLSFASLWTWIVAKLTALSTISGAKSFSGKVTLSDQGVIATMSDNDAMTKGLSSRGSIYDRVRFWFVASGAPAGCAVVDSGTVASAVQVYNYTSGAYPLPILGLASEIYRNAMTFDAHHIISLDFYIDNMSGTAVGWIVCGETYTKATVSDPTKKGFGIKLSSAGAALWVHNGTTLAVGAAFAVAANGYIHTIVIEYYSGTLAGFIDGVAMGSVTGGPSGASAANDTAVSFQAKTGATNERCRFGVMFPKSLSTAN